MTTSIYQLHDKAIRGEMLTADEEAELAEWYVQQNREEEALLSSSGKSVQALGTLRAEVETALLRLETSAQQMRIQAEKNATLRRDIAVSVHLLQGAS